MRIFPISPNYYRNTNIKQQPLNSAISNNRTNNYPVNFRGLWDKDDNPKTDIFDRFQYGLDALDDNTMLIVYADRNRAVHYLAQEISRLNNPIFKYYFLELPKTNPDLKKLSVNEANFGFYKENGKYYIMSLAGEFFATCVFPKNRDYDAETDIIRTGGNIKQLEENDRISLGIGCKELFFHTPKRYSTIKADSKLETVSRLDKKEQVKAFNQGLFVNKAKIQKEQEVEKLNKQFTFEDVGGLEDIITELKKYVIRPVNYPQVYENIRLNKGILLYGPPRCGKTLLGKALANEAGVPFKYYNANEFKSGTVGSSEESFRKVIDEAIKEKQIIFIDEIDAIGKKRDGSHNARYDDSLVNQILGSLSDLEKAKTVSFVMGATNRKDLLDDALIATGRFGLHLEVPMPNLDGIKHIYNIHTKNIKTEDNVDVEKIASKMLQSEFNGSDVAEAISISYFNALERLGMNAKMDSKTLSYDDIISIKIAEEDILNAIEQISSQKIK